MPLSSALCLLVSIPTPIVWLLVVLHVFICVFLIIVVLLQSGRAADLASAFGASQTQANIAAMSSEDFIKKATRYLAFTFMATSLILTAAPRSQTEVQRRLNAASKAKAAATSGVTGASAPAVMPITLTGPVSPSGPAEPSAPAEPPPAEPSGPSGT